VSDAAAIRVAEGYLEANRPAEAARELAAVLARRPDHVRATCLAARAALALHDPEEALSLARHAVQLQPDGEWQYRLQSVALSQLGRHREATAAAERAVALAPQLWNTHARLAYTAVASGRATPRSVQAAAEAIRLAPGNPETHNVAGWVELRRHPRRAKQHFLAALRIDPQNDDAHNGLAALRINRGDAGAGAKRALQQLRSDPRSRTGLELLGAAAHRAAWLLCFVPLLIGRLAANVLERGVPAERGGSVAVLSLVALTLPAVGLWLLVLRWRMGAALWAFLASVPRLQPALLVWAAVFVVGVALQVAAPFTPTPLAAVLLEGGGALPLLGLVAVVAAQRVRARRRPRS
jgi:tetratricopeptide (TPR) repeat protein